MADIKPIETHYNGYRFRSRLEARWAVFFDAAGIRYEYEPEGYVLSDGSCYLPDFYLTDLHMFMEIKPSNIDRKSKLEAMKKLEELFNAETYSKSGDGIAVALAVGEPANYETFCYCYYGMKKTNKFKTWFSFFFAKSASGYSIISDCAFKFDKKFVSINVFGIQTEGMFSDSGFDSNVPLLNGFEVTKADYLKTAVEKARKARFEHGECG